MDNRTPLNQSESNNFVMLIIRMAMPVNRCHKITIDCLIFYTPFSLSDLLSVCVFLLLRSLCGDLVSGEMRAQKCSR